MLEKTNHGVTLLPNCPNCGRYSIHRSRRRGMEKLFLLALVRPARCGRCLHRFFRPLFYPTLPKLHRS